MAPDQTSPNAACASSSQRLPLRCCDDQLSPAGHASAIMWQRDLRRAYLLVDREMCSVCHRTICNTLPAGATLLVYSDAEGKTIVRSTHAS